MKKYPEDFEKAIQFTLRWEGGYVNDPDDPGGETNYGIAKAFYPDLDIKNLTKEQAIEIYYKDYWLRYGCDKLPYPLNIAFFDSTVNPGIKHARRFLQTAGEDVYKFLMARVSYYVKRANRVKRLRKFLRGWLNRTVDLFDYIEQLRSSEQNV